MDTILEVAIDYYQAFQQMWSYNLAHSIEEGREDVMSLTLELIANQKREHLFKVIATMESYNA